MKRRNYAFDPVLLTWGLQQQAGHPENPAWVPTFPKTFLSFYRVAAALPRDDVSVREMALRRYLKGVLSTRRACLGLSIGARQHTEANTDLGKGVNVLEDTSNTRKTVLMGYDPDGFEVGDISYRGPIMAFPESCYLWKANKVEDITPEALSAITMIKPPIEIVVIGTGERLDRSVAKEAIESLTSRGLVVEQMDTENAVSLFNILNEEDRRVAGAFLTPGTASSSSSSSGGTSSR